MKLSFKSLLIIFLTALLGGSLGTYSMFVIHDKDVPYSTLNIHQVEYQNTALGSYSTTVEKTVDSVVVIECKTAMQSTFYGTIEGKSQGSGVIISKDGFIITNNHVIESSTETTVVLSSGERVEAQIVGADARTDVAIIKIDKDNLPFALFGDSDQLTLGQEVIAIGNPLGLGISVSNGIVSALQKEVYLGNVYMDLIQTNAAVNEGNSGGGLFDMNGNLIGIVNAKTSSSLSSNVEGMGYAIPANTAIRIIQDLMDYGYVRNRATIGIRVYTNNSIYAEAGILVSEVVEGGGADEAGIIPGDIILAIDGKNTASYADLSKILDSHSVGESVKIKIQRNGELIELPVTLHEATQ